MPAPSYASFQRLNLHKWNNQRKLSKTIETQPAHFTEQTSDWFCSSSFFFKTENKITGKMSNPMQINTKLSFYSWNTVSSESETWCVPSVQVWWRALCDKHDSGEVASTTHCFRLWWKPFHQLPASEWRLKTERAERGGLVETNLQLKQSKAIVWNSWGPQQPNALTLRLNEIICCERVPVFFVLQTRRVKVLADHMQVHMTVKDK